MVAVFDSTVFNIAAHIDCCDIIVLAATHLFQEILMPQEVKNELLKFPFIHEPLAGNRIQTYIRYIEKANKKGLKLCQTFEAIVFAQIEALVDKGEAEGIAQAEKVVTKFFFTDDNVCKSALGDSYEHLGFYSTLHLISLLDVGGWLPDYTQVIKEYFAYKPLPIGSSKRKNTLQNFRNDYLKAAKHFSILPIRKELTKKISPKILGL